MKYDVYKYLEDGETLAVDVDATAIGHENLAFTLNRILDQNAEILAANMRIVDMLTSFSITVRGKKEDTGKCAEAK